MSDTLQLVVRWGSFNTTGMAQQMSDTLQFVVEVRWAHHERKSAFYIEPLSNSRQAEAYRTFVEPFL